MKTLSLDGKKLSFNHYRVIKELDGAVLIVGKSEKSEYILFEDKAEAGKYARECCEKMAHDSPLEFACLVSLETLVAWASCSDRSGMKEWLDGIENDPERFFYGRELDVGEVSSSAAEEIGFVPTVAYRRS